jgi:glycosyltransferase involved in cell wall biosynthesis
MRVMQLTQYLAMGGLERCVTNLAVDLKSRGIETCVAVYEKDGMCELFRGQLYARGIPVFGWQKAKGFCIKTLINLLLIVSRNKIQVIHSHDLGALIYAVLVSILTFFSVRVVHTQHSFVHFNKNKSRYVFYERLFPLLAGHICTVSVALEKCYHSLGIPRKKVSTIPNGIWFPSELQSRASAIREIEVKHRLNTLAWQRIESSNKRILLSLGRIVPGKGVDRIARLWSLVSEETTSQWVLFLLGPANDLYLESEILPHLESLNDRCFVLGPTDMPFLFYSAADAFISLSEQEGMPLSAYEAIGSGLPALLSDIDGHSALSSNASLLSDNGDLRDAENLSAWLQGMSRRDSGLSWKKMEKFRKSVSFSSMVESYLKMYRKFALIAVFVATSFFIPSYLSANYQSQALTSVLERPEYLLPSDWENEFDVFLSRGEKILLTLKNQDRCGMLPELSQNLLSSGLTIQWYGGVSLPVQKASFEGAVARPYVDALVPLKKEVPCSGTPEIGFSWLFGEIQALPTALPGKHSGRLVSRMRTRNDTNGVPSKIWNFQIEIFSYRLPEKWQLPLRAEFTPFFASLAHFGASSVEEGALTRKYIAAMVENRILPLKSWIKHPFQSDGQESDADFLLSRFPNQKLSFTSSVLSVLPDWVEVDVPRTDKPEEAERATYWNRWQDWLFHDSEDPVEQFTKIRFRNRPFVYLWDEPTQEQFGQMHIFAESVKTFAPLVANLVTIYPWDSFQEHIQIFAPLLQQIAREGKPTLRPGRELWSYVSCMSHGCGSDYSSGEPDFVIERNSAYIRVWAWMANEYDLKTVLYYSVNNFWRKSLRTDPWSDLYDFSGNGDGTLFYPGRPGMFGLNEHLPVPSLRIKFWQQASFDAEYVQLAKKINPSCFEKAKNQINLVKDAFIWNRDSRVYQKVRLNLIECVRPHLQQLTSSLGSGQ